MNVCFWIRHSKWLAIALLASALWPARNVLAYVFPERASALSVAQVGDGQVALLLSGYNERGHYYLERAASMTGPYQGVKFEITLHHKDHSALFTDKELRNNRAYFYIVKTREGDGKAVTSNEVKVVPHINARIPVGASGTLNLTGILTSNYDNTPSPPTWDICDPQGVVIATSNDAEPKWIVIAEDHLVVLAPSNAALGKNYELRTQASGSTYFDVGPAPTRPPATPSRLRASGDDTSVFLTWSASSQAARYNVYQVDAADQEVRRKVADGVTDTAYTAVGLKNGQRYRYWVSAVNSSGESAATLSASAIPDIRVTYIAFSKIGLIGGRTTMGTVTINGPAPARGSEILLSADKEAVAVPRSVMIAPGKNTATFVVTSNVVTFTQSVGIYAAYTGLSVVSHASTSLDLYPAINIDAVAVGPDRIALYWQGCQGATGYNIYRRDLDGIFRQLATDISPVNRGPRVRNSYLFSDLHLVSSIRYSYYVAAINGRGTEIARSNVSSISPNLLAIPWDSSDPGQIVPKIITAFDAVHPQDRYKRRLFICAGPDGVIYESSPDGGPARAFAPVGYVDNIAGRIVHADGSSSPLPGDTQNVSESPYQGYCQVSRYGQDYQHGDTAEGVGTGPQRKVEAEDTHEYCGLSADIVLPTNALMWKGKSYDGLRILKDEAYIYSGGSAYGYAINVDAGLVLGTAKCEWKGTSICGTFQWEPTVFNAKAAGPASIYLGAPPSSAGSPPYNPFNYSNIVGAVHVEISGNVHYELRLPNAPPISSSVPDLITMAISLRPGGHIVARLFGGTDGAGKKVTEQTYDPLPEVIMAYQQDPWKGQPIRLKRCNTIGQDPDEIAYRWAHPPLNRHNRVNRRIVHRPQLDILEDRSYITGGAWNNVKLLLPDPLPGGGENWQPFDISRTVRQGSTPPPNPGPSHAFPYVTWHTENLFYNEDDININCAPDWNNSYGG